MAGVLQDASAPGVSDVMRRRIGASLGARELPQMRGQNLRLGTIVLQRADGRDAPALAEVENQSAAVACLQITFLAVMAPPALFIVAGARMLRTRTVWST